MKSPIIKDTRLLNTILKRLQYYKINWSYNLHYLIKQITYKNKLYDIDHLILDYLLVHR